MMVSDREIDDEDDTRTEDILGEDDIRLQDEILDGYHAWWDHHDLVDDLHHWHETVNEDDEGNFDSSQGVSSVVKTASGDASATSD